MKNYLLLFWFALMIACSPKNGLMIADNDALFEEETFDTLVVTPETNQPPKQDNKNYNAAFERKHDLIHTKLEISFNWEKQHVLGVAELQLKPFFYASNELVLDAKGFDIHSIKLSNRDLKYTYSGDKIWITLDREYKRNETYAIQIKYTAKPNEGPEGGSAAITSNKGLFFINPLGMEKGKPQQIWTQGETENNSKWFPTIDKPNERCTQEIYLTVQDRFKTLSNGKLISSKKNSDGTRTDHWKQDQPHAPYLFMLAIGEYAVVNDQWRDLPLHYYVEPIYQDHAKSIFNHTPEMLTFFSEILDYPYPWDKYAQVVCREYVSGAMENTGAVIFGEFVQKTTNELIDDNNDNIVAHEMFHHWFGDLVTCESWSNLTLNEGFANYSEYLWQEHKYGYYAAEHHRLNEMNAYIESAMTSGMHPLIHFHYNDKEEMFDAHSYNKGGMVLHMLRFIVGDEAFFASLNKYLVDNKYTAVEADELRLAFEDTTGKDLNWFFDQWYFDEGHPILDVTSSINIEQNNVTINVKQIQTEKDQNRVFQLPTEIALYYADGTVEYYPATIDQAVQEISIPIRKAPEFVVLDGKRNLLAIIFEERTEEEYVKLFKYSNQFLDQYQAISALSGNALLNSVIDDALNHDYYLFRSHAISTLEDEKHLPQLTKMAQSDPHSQVRKVALDKILFIDPIAAADVSKKIIKAEKATQVVGKAIDVLYSVKPSEAMTIIDEIAVSNPKPFLGTIADIYSRSADPQYLGFFEKNLGSISIYELWHFTNLYIDLAENGSANDLVSVAENLKNNISFGGANKKTLLMYNMGRILKKLSNDLGNKDAEEGSQIVRKYMDQIIAEEKDQNLVEQYKSYLE